MKAAVLVLARSDRGDRLEMVIGAIEDISILRVERVEEADRCRRDRDIIATVVDVPSITGKDLKRARVTLDCEVILVSSATNEAALQAELRRLLAIRS